MEENKEINNKMKNEKSQKNVTRMIRNSPQKVINNKCNKYIKFFANHNNVEITMMSRTVKELLDEQLILPARRSLSLNLSHGVSTISKKFSVGGY